MDHFHSTRRAASHGALDKSYTADASHLHRRPLPRHPLRSVSENVSLLVSPGPLESMLKTTTETGDIGLFSIRPVRSSSSIPGPSRRRPSFGDLAYRRSPNSQRMLQRSSNFKDDRIWLPSYRNTNSEIISMYGSDSNRSAASSVTPPFDDRAQRSYSMTTCSSRPLTNQKSTGTVQSHQGDGILQRPRSSFPYPTRLKRPGVRPSSPAMTESGAVDYSRMVVIDRVSRRTVHGSYKPTYPQHNTRPLPRARFDSNKPNEYSSGCNMSPVSPAAWGNRYQPRLNSSASEHSLRTSSLTSIVNMYQRSTCGSPSREASLQIQPPGAFYYDYSEGFDCPSEERPPMPDFPAHISARARSLCRQINEAAASFRGSGRYDAVPTPVPSIASEPYTPQSSIMEAEQSEDATDEGNLLQSQRMEARPQHSLFPSLLMFSGYEAADGRLPPTSTPQPSTAVSPGNDEGVCSVGTAVVQKRQNANLTIRGPLHISSPGYLSRSMTTGRSCGESTPWLASSPAHSSSRLRNPHRSLPASYRRHDSISSVQKGQNRRSRFYSVEPRLSDSSSLVEYLDKTRNPTSHPDFTNSSQERGGSNSTFPDSSGQFQDENQASNLPLTGELLLDEADGEVSPRFVTTPSFRRHKRNLAVPRIHTGNLLTTPDPELGSIADRSKTPMLAPQPISPARQLRLQNSVPQLMKALPPLPGGSANSESFIDNNSVDESESAMWFSSIGLSNITMLKPTMKYPETPCNRQNRAGREVGDDKYMIGSAMADNRESQTLKQQISPSAELTSPFGFCDQGPVAGEIALHDDNLDMQSQQHSNTQPEYGKLKLKVSRGALTALDGDFGGPRRNTVLEPPIAWNDGLPGPEPWVRISLYGGTRDPVRMVSCMEPRMEKGRNEMFGVTSVFSGRPEPSTLVPPLLASHSGQSLRIDRRASHGTHGPTGATSPTSIADASSSLSIDSCVSNMSPRGLRKWLSKLRILFDRVPHAINRGGNSKQWAFSLRRHSQRQTPVEFPSVRNKV